MKMKSIYLAVFVMLITGAGCSSVQPKDNLQRIPADIESKNGGSQLRSLDADSSVTYRTRAFIDKTGRLDFFWQMAQQIRATNDELYEKLNKEIDDTTITVKKMDLNPDRDTDIVSREPDKNSGGLSRNLVIASRAFKKFKKQDQAFMVLLSLLHGIYVREGKSQARQNAKQDARSAFFAAKKQR